MVADGIRRKGQADGSNVLIGKESSDPWLIAPARYQHHAFSQDIVSRIKQLKPDNWHGIAYILKDYAVITACIVLTHRSHWWFYPIALILIGAHQRGISTILHDSAHGVLARNNTLNFLLGTLPTSWPIFQRYFSYRKSHVQTHHPYLGRADADPDLEFFIEQGVFTPMSDVQYLFKMIIMPMFGSKTPAYLRYLIQNRYKMIKDIALSRPKSDKTTHSRDWRDKFDAYGFLVFWAGIWVWSIVAGWWWQLLLFWVVPYVTSFHIIGWFIELSEHSSSIEGQTVNLHMTRNRSSRHIERWLTAINNDDYHLDHHLDPSTPFWLLDKAHRIRMSDADYAYHVSSSGGIFQKGKAGAPSIVSLLRQQNLSRFRQSAPS
nr:fatty acid desaturase family protein [uncultured Acidocella sp.]